jgi:AcrR family transcriptional regulator
MSPRSYQLGLRQEQIDEGRRRVIDAARGLLSNIDSYQSFTVDAVAKRADVARATIYYQFGSKAGLLEAVCDALAIAGGMSDLPAAFTAPTPADGMRILIAVFNRFWAEDRTVMRRLRALAALDPDVRAVIAGRDDRRRSAIETVIEPLLADRDAKAAVGADQLVQTIWMLTSFETFDALTSTDRPVDVVTSEIVRLAEAAL